MPGVTYRYGALGSIRGISWLADGKPGIVITIDDVSKSIGAGTMTFTVTLSSPAPTGGLTVQYATNDDTATAGTHYTASSGTVSFAEGESTKTIVINTL